MYLPAGFSDLRVWTGIKGNCDYEKTDSAVRTGDGGEQPGKKRKAAGV